MTMHPRSRRALLGAGILLAAPRLALGQTYPSHPIALMVGSAPGGSNDYVARLVARELGPLLGQTVTVDNRPGAGGNLATQAMLRAAPDGHTLCLAGITLATNPAMMAMGYDPATDLQMIGQTCALPVVLLASMKSGFRSLADVVRAGQRTEIPFGSGGVGTSSHLGVALLKRATGTRYDHVVFRGGALAVQALIAGDVDAMFEPVAPYHFDMARAGQIRLICTLQDTPLPPMPDLPTVASLGHGPELQFQSWQGLMVRSGTPAAIVERLHAALNQAVASPTLIEALRRIAIEPKSSASPEAFQQLYRAELDRWGAVIRAEGVTTQ